MEDLSTSMEDYLEAILLLLKDKKEARTKEIADFLNVKMPSVNSAFKKLSESGYINYNPYKIVTLTKKGQLYAEKIYSKHKSINDFFEIVLSLSPEEANKYACELEHILDKKLIEKLTHLVSFLNNCDLKCNNFKKFNSKLHK